MSADTIHQQIAEAMPLSKTALDLRTNGQGFGLIIVDEVNGFATVGAGNLAPCRSPCTSDMHKAPVFRRRTDSCVQRMRRTVSCREV